MVRQEDDGEKFEVAQWEFPFLFQGANCVNEPRRWRGLGGRRPPEKKKLRAAKKFGQRRARDGYCRRQGERLGAVRVASVAQSRGLLSVWHEVHFCFGDFGFSSVIVWR